MGATTNAEAVATIELLRRVAGALTHPAFGTQDGRAKISELLAVAANLLEDVGDHWEELEDLAERVGKMISTEDEPTEDDWKALKEKYDAAHKRIQQAS